jgi:beta-glucosidase
MKKQFYTTQFISFVVRFLSVLLLAIPSIVHGQKFKTITAGMLQFEDLNGDGQLQSYEDTRLSNSARIADLLPRLSVEEKLSLLIGDGGFDPKNPVIGGGRGPVPGAAGITKALDKFGISCVVMTDGPAGVRIPATRENDSKTYYATAFPVGTVLACSWDKEVVYKVGEALGEEARDYGSDIQLTPGMNIMRNPLCGRNFEYLSEDPLISGKIASALTKGIQSTGVGVSAKHFVANNNETNRMSINSNVSQRALREIYLRGFQILVKEANPATIMSTYHKLNGVYTSANYDLLTTVLRDEWGYKGLVMTDWFGGFSRENLISNQLADNIGAAQIKAGNNLLMPGLTLQTDKIKQALQLGTLSEDALNEAVKTILFMVFASPKIQGKTFSNQPDLKGHALVVRSAAAEGMVLLKNETQTLPLAAGIKKLGVFGVGSWHFIPGGTGSGFVNKVYSVSLTEGLRKAGYSIDPSLEKLYADYSKKDIATLVKKLNENAVIEKPALPQPKISKSIFTQSAKTQDMAVITIGRVSGEMTDRKVNDDFNLTNEETALISAVSAAFHDEQKKVVVVLNIGGVIETNSWRDKVDAILVAWQPGQEGGNSVTDILTGKVNPSGKLTMTFPLAYSDVPSSPDFPGTPAELPTQALYKEGIYVGYRYYSSFNKKVAYEFGYGLSYTNFSVDNIRLNDTSFNDEIFLTVDVTNNGQVKGKEVVQLYLSAPQAQIDKPVIELKAFAKSKALQPGEKQTLVFKIGADELASFYPEKSAWMAEPGNYTLYVGNSSAHNKPTATFKLNRPIIVEKVHNVLNNSANFEDMKR